MNVWQKLLSIDRRWIYVVLAVVVIVPLLVPFKIEPRATPPVAKLFNYIDTMPEDKALVISVDFTPDTQAELLPMVIAMLRHAFATGHKVGVLTLDVYGLGLGRDALAQVSDEFNAHAATREDSVINGEDYVFWGWTTPWITVMLGMGERIASVFPIDYFGSRTESLPITRGLKNYDDVGILVTCAASAFPKSWINYAQVQYGVHLGCGITAVSAADFYPYLNSGQFTGMLAGMKGAAEYEELLADRLGSRWSFNVARPRTDVAVTRLRLAERSPVDSGTKPIPSATIANLGTRTMAVPLTLSIGSDYAADTAVSVGPGESLQVRFEPWAATGLGRVTADCRAVLPGDIDPQNDARRTEVTVIAPRVDVAVRAIAAPGARCLAGRPVVPAVVVRNLGAKPVDALLELSAAGAATYRERLLVPLAPRQDTTVALPGWTPQTAGRCRLTARATAAGDYAPRNNAVSAVVEVVPSRIDAWAVAVLAPDTFVDSGSVIAPVVRIVNKGTDSAMVPVHVDLAAYAADTILRVPPRGVVRCTLRPWMAMQVESLVCRLRVALPGDENTGNDTVVRKVRVMPAVNASARALSDVPANVGAGTTITPRVSVANQGAGAAVVPVRVSIVRVPRRGAARDTVYRHDLSAALAAGAETSLAAPPWLTDRPGRYRVVGRTDLDGDWHKDDDSVVRTISVVKPMTDVALLRIVRPAGGDTVDSGSALAPRVRLRNSGSLPVSVSVTIGIGDAYQSAVTADIAPGETADVEAGTWPATMLGSYTVTASVSAAGDDRSENDTASAAFTVAPRVDAGVVHVAGPTGLVEIGAAVPLSVLVANLGTRAENVPVRLTIGTVYSESGSVELEPGQTAEVELPAWRVDKAGTFPLVAVAALDGDRNHENDTLRDREFRRRGTEAMSSQTTAHMAIMLFIIVGNAAFLATRRRKP